ncbi:hypothetical protein [Nonomuraea basaltis]|uniref:hypothetical protein n=1 Tax=Nonomuraea basaltis TaxID=2495887 RepID=UPI001F0F49A8|nr:hypothetical protein [Nonomuraea basaltis]
MTTNSLPPEQLAAREAWARNAAHLGYGLAQHGGWGFGMAVRTYRGDYAPIGQFGWDGGGLGGDLVLSAGICAVSAIMAGRAEIRIIVVGLLVMAYAAGIRDLTAALTLSVTTSALTVAFLPGRRTDRLGAFGPGRAGDRRRRRNGLWRAACSPMTCAEDREPLRGLGRRRHRRLVRMTGARDPRDGSPHRYRLR